MMCVPRDAVRGGDRPALELELERTPEAPSLARAAVLDFCRGRELSPSTMATIALLVSETVTNAVIHPEVAPPGRISFRARWSEAAIRIEVRDQGYGFTPKPRDPNQVKGGYGLYLLDKEAARWGVESEPHTAVWFEVAPGPG
jgi:anti-sigma regulatory factor (Ser/Thr protein kinase)